MIVYVNPTESRIMRVSRKSTPMRNHCNMDYTTGYTQVGNIVTSYQLDLG